MRVGSPARLAGLVARTTPLDGEVDLVACAGDDGVLFWQPGLGLAGRGVAASVELPAGIADVHRVADLLGGIECWDEVGAPGSGPLAIGALPFHPTAPSSLVVPETVVGRDASGRAWLTRIGQAMSVVPPVGHPVNSLPRKAPHRYRLDASGPHERWCATVAAALDEIAAGRLEKVVLARYVDVEADTAIDRADVLARLRALYPSCTVFAVGTFVGASPELLVGREGDEVVSHPVAGTVRRSGDPDADARAAAALLASTKERREHALVVDAVVSALAPVCAELSVPATPSVVALRNLSHLGTRVRGRLTQSLSALELAARLHPTPAVGGVPREAALDYIAAHEGFDRGRYAGPVGWVDARGDGCWVVGIRSAELDGARARLFAGNGIVAGADPGAELAETQLKLQALLAAVVRP